jgi:hypothetical protein
VTDDSDDLVVIAFVVAITTKRQFGKIRIRHAAMLSEQL